jgi:DNA-binding protein H-NS
MDNLIEIQSQIGKLQKQADEIKAKEFDRTVQDILAKMKAFDISLKDLQPGKQSKAGKERGAKDRGNGRSAKTVKPNPKGNSNPVAAKFRGPNGEVWSGRGLTPRWLSALVALGQTKEEFAIKN